MKFVEDEKGVGVIAKDFHEEFIEFLKEELKDIIHDEELRFMVIMTIKLLHKKFLMGLVEQHQDQNNNNCES